MTSPVIRLAVGQEWPTYVFKSDDALVPAFS